MRVIKRSTLRPFWGKHTDAKAAVETWYRTAVRADWHSFQEIKQTFGSADVIPGNRVVFNIKGNKYRLIVKLHYNRGIIYIRFVGTHAAYDKIDAETI